MIQVPSFGMENNPASLLARRQAFMRSYGYAEVDVQNAEEFTEVIGHVPSVPVPHVTILTLPSQGKLLLTFYSTVTPYTRAWVRREATEAQAFVDDLERSGLWTLAQIGLAN